MIPLAVIGAVLGLPLLVAVSSLWRGYVLSVLWGWFIVPTFHLPNLPLVAAIGLSIIVNLLSSTASQPESKSQSERIGRMVALVILGPAFALGIGWIVHLFMPR